MRERPDTDLDDLHERTFGVVEHPADDEERHQNEVERLQRQARGPSRIARLIQREYVHQDDPYDGDALDRVQQNAASVLGLRQLLPHRSCDHFPRINHFLHIPHSGSDRI